jgi:hypothetical protein
MIWPFIALKEVGSKLVTLRIFSFVMDLRKKYWHIKYRHTDDAGKNISYISNLEMLSLHSIYDSHSVD